MPFDTDGLILSKSLALVEKTRWRVSQIDTAGFPTVSTEIPRNLLLTTLDSMGNQSFWSAMNPEAFYSALIQIQDLVEKVEASTSDHISWPLVSYCDHFWKLLFPANEAKIFYSVFAEHNYGIGSFTESLRLILDPVLPPSEIDRIIDKKKVYFLQIASMEDENLPLYANIGHEFGHALFWAKESEILKILFEETISVLRIIQNALNTQDAALAGRRFTRILWIVKGIATELFCDQVGGMIAGPAFLLSLHEMGWGTDANLWSTRLSPRDASTKAYPSFAFRLSCLKSFLDTEDFEKELTHKLEPLPRAKGSLKTISSHVAEIPTQHTRDHPSVRPESDGDAKAIRQAVETHLAQIKTVLAKYLERCSLEILKPYKILPEFSSVSGEHVSELIQRLDANILPNIIPNGTLLGTPASFATILNASALYRMHVLSNRGADGGSLDINRQIQKVERLTAKALEVSYIQGEFNAWEVMRR